PALYTLSLHDALPIYPRHRRQRPLLLVVSADHLRRVDAADAPAAARRREPVAQADAAPGAAEDPAVRLVRGGMAVLRRFRREHPDRKSTRLNSSHVSI